MRINHIALYVSNLELMKEFYCTYFGAVANNRYHNPKTGLQTYFLSFDDGARIEIMQKPDVTEKKGNLNTLGYIHIAFCTKNNKCVDELTDVLRLAGYQVISGPRTTGDGYYESCVLDPEGNQIEITT